MRFGFERGPVPPGPLDRGENCARCGRPVPAGSLTRVPPAPRPGDTVKLLCPACLGGREEDEDE